MSNNIKNKNSHQLLFIAYNTIYHPIYYAYQLLYFLYKTIKYNNIKTSNNKLSCKSNKNILGENSKKLEQKQSCSFRTIPQALISPLIVLLLPLMIASTLSASPFFKFPESPLILLNGRHHFQYPFEQKLQRQRTFFKRSGQPLPMEECLLNPTVQKAATALLADLPATSMTEESKKQRMAEPREYLTETGVECLNEENKGVNNGDDREFAPGMSIEIRSICPFIYVENVNERRLPRRITEVRCLCERPRQRSATHHSSLHCEPLHFSIPVLLFDDEQCTESKRSFEQVTLGCIAVHGPSSRSGFLSSIGQPRPLIISEQQF
ncbi:hypothetical protein Mgra_00006165 [Meloidogyne graminicola]|uniref:Uncharacterized protein n=1 Tax=Meloidogyne graminicola TaxID=189291 RepID=A0A8S9ZM67_9BILA|nr:hypothetical protein Mgra_00006165 [Meloidogyne graminicola]